MYLHKLMLSVSFSGEGGDGRCQSSPLPTSNLEYLSLHHCKKDDGGMKLAQSLNASQENLIVTNSVKPDVKASLKLLLLLQRIFDFKFQEK